MQERTRNIAVGLTAFAGLVCLAVLALLFGNLPDWLSGGYIVRIHFASASGLNESSRVQLNGIDIGRVTEVRLEPPPERGVVVTARINDDILIPTDAFVHAQSPLLGGSPVLAFIARPGVTPEQETYLPTDNSADIRGKALTMVSQFAGEMQAALQQPIAQFGQLTQSFEELSAQWTDVGRNINLLVEQRRPEAVDAGEASGNLATIMQRADDRLAEMRDVIGGINEWVNDPEFREHIQSAVAHADSAIKKLDATADRVDQLVVGANDRFTDLAERYIAIADDLGGALDSVRRLAERARSGEGTVGKLLNDPAIFDNLNDATERLNVVLDELKLLLEKWKAEGVPVRF